MKTLAELVRLLEPSDRSICEPHAHNGQLQLKASDLGHCAVYEKELQRVWPTIEENRRTKIAEFGEKHGFRLAYYKQGQRAIFLDESARPRTLGAKPQLPVGQRVSGPRKAGPLRGFSLPFLRPALLAR